MRPWISSAVADGTVFAWLSWPVFEVCGPSQVLWDVYTEVLEAAHPLHRGPTDHKRSVGQPLSLPEVHDQLFSFAHVQRETVVLAPWCKSLYLIQLCGLIIVGNEAQNHSIISKFDNRSGAVRGHAVVCVDSECINTCLCSGRFLRIRQSCSLFRHQFPVSVWGLWKTPPHLNTKICSSFAEGHHISHCICNSQKQSTTHTKALTDDFCYWYHWYTSLESHTCQSTIKKSK